MNFRYIGDPNDQTPEGINTGPLYISIYGYKWRKFEDVVEVPDTELIKDATGVPVKPPMLICKKLLGNRHFELVGDTQETVEAPKPKRKYKRRKSKVTEPDVTITERPAEASLTEA